jgi:L-asparaginase II
VAGPISVVARRGGAVESCHIVHAVAVQDGRAVMAAGDPGFVTFLRSSAKPFQALPLVRAVPDLGAAEIAVASASHLASAAQLAAVRSLLRRAEASEDDLECGPEGDPPSRLAHNCSGKHAGMLLLCHDRGWSRMGYRRPDHAVQRAMLDEVAAAAEVDAGEIPTATDGCGVVTFALALERMAHLFAGLERRPGGAQVAEAMRSRPELIRGPGAPDTELMRRVPGWLAKGGAEGLMCAAGPGGVGVALKVADGGHRAVGPALSTFMSSLGHDLGDLAEAPLTNSRGDVVGELVSAR